MQSIKSILEDIDQLKIRSKNRDREAEEARKALGRIYSMVSDPSIELEFPDEYSEEKQPQGEAKAPQREAKAPYEPPTIKEVPKDNE